MGLCGTITGMVHTSRVDQFMKVEIDPTSKDKRDEKKGDLVMSPK